MSELQYELELDTGKKVVLSEFKIKHKNLAAKAASTAQGAEFDARMQDEILKIVLVSVDGKVLNGIEKEDLDSVFSYSEYNQVLLFIRDMVGVDAKKPQIKVLKGTGVK